MAEALDLDHLLKSLSAQTHSMILYLNVIFQEIFTNGIFQMHSCFFLVINLKKKKLGM